MPSIHRHIWNKFGIHASDIMPLNGAPWTMTATRNVLAEFMGEMGFKIGAEVGVEIGRFSRYMCDVIPNLKLYCIDPWEAYGRNSQAREDERYEGAVARLAGLNAEIMRMKSLDAVPKIANNSLDFVYIDALHDYDPVMVDIILWSPKVRSGGIVAGHDYAHYHHFGVIQAITNYTQAHSITPWYITTGEATPSWFFVKP
jgi:predicted O-methyltransferase YrrM